MTHWTGLGIAPMALAGDSVDLQVVLKSWALPEQQSGSKIVLVAFLSPAAEAPADCLVSPGERAQGIVTLDGHCSGSMDGCSLHW